MVENLLSRNRSRDVPNAAETPAATYLNPVSGSAASGQTSAADAESVADSRWLPALIPVASLSGLTQSVQPLPEPAAPTVALVTPTRLSVPRRTGVSVMVFAAPDLSSIGLKNFERPGSNAGFGVQYQLLDRLSINAGMMYSIKRYQSSADEYDLPWNWEVRPVGMVGTCTMIDVPINLRYDWLLRSRGEGRAPARWFASTGVTSYFIQHEVYIYDYADPADPKIRGRGWDNRRAGNPGGSFGFSNLNVSVGYERPFTNRLSWQVEPFLKIPLREVGFFNVRLLSTGAFIGLRYRL